jgi:DNA-binding LacI/PurR family transcriptional regulator
MNDSKNITILDIAERLGVSRTTAHKAINNLPGVNLKTKEKIQQFAQKVGYRPNLMARSLRSKKTNMIGVLISVDFDRRWYASLANKLVSCLRGRGYSVLLTVATPDDSEDERRCLEMLQGGHIDGIIAGPVFTQKRLQPYWDVVNRGQPIVFFGSAEELPVSFVDIDHVEGLRLAVKYLVEFGHKRIGYLCCHEETTILNTRSYGFERAMIESGILPKKEDMLVGRGTYESGYLTMKSCLTQRNVKDIPTAFFCQSDVAAIGAMRAIDEAGLSVPRDISLIGYDDIQEAAYCKPSLTTVGGSMDLLVTRLQEILVSQIENDIKSVQEYIKPQLIIRESVANLKNEIA